MDKYKKLLLEKHPSLNEYINLIDVLENEVIEFYESNDEMHKLSHVYEVISHCLDLVMFSECNPYLRKTYTDNSVSIPNILLAGFTHDIASDLKDLATREKHHIIGAKYVMENELFRKYYTEENLKYVSGAVITHRASLSIPNFPSALAELFACGDRLYPSLEDLVKRALLNEEAKVRNLAVLNGVIKHIQEKFGTDGYITYPKYYKVRYGERIEELKKQVDVLDVEYLLKYLKD